MKTKKFVKYILFCDCLIVSQLAIALEKFTVCAEAKNFPILFFYYRRRKRVRSVVLFELNVYEVLISSSLLTSSSYVKIVMAEAGTVRNKLVGMPL
jgi:hypothetical protein